MHLMSCDFERFLFLIKDEDEKLSDDIIFNNALLQTIRIINT